jgi:hypothetical protein
MSAGTGPARGSLSFRRIVNVPVETCAAAFDPARRAGEDGELRFGDSLLRGPVEHNRGTGTHRIQVRLARGPLRPPLPMRLDIDRWSATSTALELIPGRRVRPTTAYFRAGHTLLDSLARAVPRHLPAAPTPGTAILPPLPAGSGRRSAPRPLRQPQNSLLVVALKPHHAGSARGREPRHLPAPRPMRHKRALSAAAATNRHPR